MISYWPDWATLAQFTIATAVLVITPGPDMTLFVGRTLSHGRAAGFACMAGALTGCLVHVTLVAAGLSALLVASPQAFWVLKVCGAAYLAWLAWQALRHGSVFAPDAKAKGPQRSLLAHWAAGVSINLLNPKVILFFMTFLPQFVTPGDPEAAGKLFVLGALFIPLSLPIAIPMVLAADRMSRTLRNAPRITRVIDYAFAGIFTAFAIRILTAQAR